MKADFSKKDYFDYAWKHFTVIADQRLKTFNFYIIIVGASVAATASAYKNDKPFWLLLVCGALQVVCALIFFLIDQRSLRLINGPKKILASMEEEAGWELFRADIAGQRRFRNKISSYTFAFRIAFAAQCAFGLLVVFVAFFPGAGPTAAPAPLPKPAVQSLQQPLLQRLRIADW